jgi:hypothetical protein
LSLSEFAQNFRDEQVEFDGLSYFFGFFTFFSMSDLKFLKEAELVRLLPKLGPRRRFVGYLQEQKQKDDEKARRLEEEARKAAEPPSVVETKIVPYVDPAIFGPLPDFSEDTQAASENLREIVAADLERASQARGLLGNEFDEMFGGATKNLNAMPELSDFDAAAAARAAEQPKSKPKQVDVLPWEEIEIPKPVVPPQVQLASSELLSSTSSALAQIDRLVSRAGSAAPNEEAVSAPMYFSTQQRSASSAEAQRKAAEAEMNRVLAAATNAIPAGVLPPLSADLAPSLRAAFGAWSSFYNLIVFKIKIRLDEQFENAL